MVILGLTIYDIETGGRIHRRIEYDIVNDADRRTLTYQTLRRRF